MKTMAVLLHFKSPCYFLVIQIVQEENRSSSFHQFIYENFTSFISSFNVWPHSHSVARLYQLPYLLIIKVKWIQCFSCWLFLFSSTCSAASDASSQPASPEPDRSKPKKNRCFTCRKKVGLTGKSAYMYTKPCSHLFKWESVPCFRSTFGVYIV